MLAILDCNIGNIGSLVNTFSYLGETAEVISLPEQLRDYDAVVLPGVGAFDPAMRTLEAVGLTSEVKKFSRTGKPLLGICLGLQLLCNSSQEGSLPGLQLVSGDIKHLRSLGCQEKVPHVGFNSVDDVIGDSRFLSLAQGNDFYFVHSFVLNTIQSNESTISVAYSEYGGIKFISAFQHNNIFATQFHPEKSGEAGLALLSEFISCSKNA